MGQYDMEKTFNSEEVQEAGLGPDSRCLWGCRLSWRKEERTRTRSPSSEGLEEHPSGAEVLKQEARTGSQREQTSPCLAFNRFPPSPVYFYGDGAILKNAQRYKNKARITYLGFRRDHSRKRGTQSYTVRECLGKKLTTGF